MSNRLNITRFSHHISARNDFEMVELMDKHGFTGYAVYFMLLEIIFAHGYEILPIGQPAMLKKFAREIGMNADELKAIIYDMVQCGLFDKDVYLEDEGLTNAMIAHDFDYIRKRRMAGKLGAKARWSKT